MHSHFQPLTNVWPTVNTDFDQSLSDSSPHSWAKILYALTTDWWMKRQTLRKQSLREFRICEAFLQVNVSKRSLRPWKLHLPHSCFTDDRVIKRSLQWQHNERNGASKFLSRLFRRRSKKTSKLRVTGLCEGNLPATSGFPSQRVSNMEKCPFDNVIMLKLIMRNSSLGNHSKIALKCMPQSFFNEKSTLLQVLTWCHQATSHYLSQRWLQSIWSP